MALLLSTCASYNRPEVTPDVSNEDYQMFIISVYFTGSVQTCLPVFLITLMLRIMIMLVLTTVCLKKWCCILAITLRNLIWFSKFFNFSKEDKILQNICKNFQHTLNVLLHYLVKCSRSKMTQIVQKLQ